MTFAKTGVILISLIIWSFIAVTARAEQPDNSTNPKPAARRFTVNGITIVFTGPNEALVETNGQTVKIDTAARNVTEIPAGTAAAATENGDSATQEEPTADNSTQQEQPDAASAPQPEAEADPESYYAYELVNVPTPKRYEKYAFAVHFTHRFSQPAFIKAAPDLFGFDSFSASGFGFTFGVTERLYARVYRTPINRTIEMGGGFHLLHEGKKSPVSAAIYASVEGRDNFDEKYTYNIQGMLGRTISRYGAIFFSPGVALNSNAFRDLPGNRDDDHTGHFGFGGQVNFRPTGSFVVEYVPRIGFKSGTDATISFGLQKRTYRHVFTLTLSNTNGTTTSTYNSGFGGAKKGLTFGFNIYRRF